MTLVKGRVGTRFSMTVNTMKEHYEEGTSQELEAGGNGKMCQHARLILIWSAGYIMTPS
jgi:hypothetical protein